MMRQRVYPVTTGSGFTRDFGSSAGYHKAVVGLAAPSAIRRDRDIGFRELG
jgi:hypothetical protein